MSSPPLTADISFRTFATAPADTLCAILSRSGCSLRSLVVQHSGVSDLAAAGIMMAVADNTVLRTLDLSGNDIGGTSDLLAGSYPEQGERKCVL